jgi:hypothetical protein
LHEEEEHIDIREKLLNLPKAKAGDDFMNSLQRKINLADAELNQKKIIDEAKESIWVKLFGKKRNPWLIPSLSLTIVVVFVISIYVLNSEKDKLVPAISDFQKKESSSGLTPEIKTPGKDSKDRIVNQDVASEYKLDSKKSDTRSADVFGKDFFERLQKDQPVQPTVEMERMKLSEPMKTEESIDETGKSELKKEDRIYQDMEKKVSQETIAPLEKSIKGDEINQKVMQENSKESKDAIESKGLIEKKEKTSMKRAVKNTDDSTKIDKKALEKIKEEIQKEK